MKHDDSILGSIVTTYHVQDVTVEDALRALRGTDLNRILIGFEKVARRPTEKEKTVSLSLSNVTIAEILNAVCQQDTRYSYEIVDGLIIHVHPQYDQSDPPGLLNMRIEDFSVEGKMLPAAVIVRMDDLAPELASYLATKRNDYYARQGISPASPGSLAHGNMDPKISLHLHDMTVRDILSATVLYSLRLNQETPADWTGNKIPPTSWIYEFVIDPAAPTGLGGYARWIAF